MLRSCLFALLATSLASANIDCGREDSCFGGEQDCNPDNDCPSLFQFEEDGSMNLYLRDFDDPEKYAAFAVDRHPDETIEYFICRPHQGKLLRAVAELGGAVLFLEQNLTGLVEEISSNYFRCHFNDYEMPAFFHEEQMFFLSNGTYDDEVLVILGGEQMYNLELDIEEDLDAFDDEWIIPTLDYMGTPVRSAIEEKKPSGDVKDVEEKSEKNVVRTKRYDVEEEEITNIEPDHSVFDRPIVEADESFDAVEQRRHNIDETDSDEESRRLRKPMGRPSRYNQDDEDEDDEGDDDELHEDSFRSYHDSNNAAEEDSAE